MDCSNCGAVIPEITAGTCYNCGAILSTRDDSDELDAYATIAEEAFDAEAEAARATREEVEEVHELFAPPLPLFGDPAREEKLVAAAQRHPSKPLLYLHFKVWTGKSWEYVWVRAETSTQAREAIFASEMKPKPLDGDSWGNGEAFHKNRGKSVKRIGNKRLGCPGGVVRYLDQTGQWENVRTQADS